MKVTIIGAGSAGLGTAITIKKKLDANVRILERASEGEAPGLGIALLSFALNELRMLGLDDFSDRCFPIDGATHVFAGRYADAELVTQSRVQDTQYWGVKRSTLLSFLTEAAAGVGVKTEYDRDVSEEIVRREREAADLFVGADGAGSIVRNTYAGEFRPVGEDAQSRYAWLELAGKLDHFIFGYMHLAGKGLIRITAYPHSQQGSSAIITHSLGLTPYFDQAGMTDGDGSISEHGLRTINDIFANGLAGRVLVGKSRWRRFRATHCQAAAFGNVALVGDAYVTKHYETGWGTSAALQEARVLGHMLDYAFGKGMTVEEGLEVYNRKSIEIARGLIEAATRTMREMDGQSERFDELGPAKFLELNTP